MESGSEVLRYFPIQSLTQTGVIALLLVSEVIKSAEKEAE